MILYRLQNVNSQSPYEVDLNHYAYNISKMIFDMIKLHDINKKLFYNALPNNELENFNKFRQGDFYKIHYHYFVSDQHLKSWYGFWLEFLFSIGFSIKKINVPDESIFINDDGHACIST